MNTYTGPTLVKAGTLATTAESVASGAYSVADSAAFSLAVAGAFGQFNAASRPLGSTTGAALGFDLGSFGNPTTVPLNVTGNLAVNGTVVINVADALPQLGQFPLLVYNRCRLRHLQAQDELPGGVVAALVNNAANNSVDLNITSVALNIWDGLAGGNWDIGLTTNFNSEPHHWPAHDLR